MDRTQIKQLNTLGTIAGDRMLGLIYKITSGGDFSCLTHASKKPLRT